MRDPSSPPVGGAEQTRRSWLAVLGATILLQAVASFLLRVPPTIAPTLLAAANLPASAIGYLAAVSTVGSIAFLLIGAPLIRRFGSIRTLQIGGVLSLVGALGFLVPAPLAIGIAALVVGIGYGPSPAAGSDILNRYAPPGRMNLVFSVKQAGVPFGGVVAGLLLPPAVEAYGIAGAVVCCLVLGVAAVLVVQPLRAEVDATRDRRAPVGLAALIAGDNLRAPFQAVARTPELWRLALAGMCFSLCQGAWFAFLVTYLVTDIGYSLTLAGAVFAVTQATGITGRIGLGWLADRLGSGRIVLRVAGVASALCSATLAATDVTWTVWSMMALAGAAGMAVSSWNGVQISEMVRITTGEVHTTVAGATAIVFIGYLSGPPAFALLLTASGRYEACFLAVAAVGLLGAWLVPAAARR